MSIDIGTRAPSLLSILAATECTTRAGPAFAQQALVDTEPNDTEKGVEPHFIFEWSWRRPGISYPHIRLHSISPAQIF